MTWALQNEQLREEGREGDTDGERGREEGDGLRERENE